MDCGVLAVSLHLPRKRRSARAVVWNSVLVPLMNETSNFESSVKICLGFMLFAKWMLMHLRILCMWNFIYAYLDPCLPFFLILLHKINSSVIQHQQSAIARKDSCAHLISLTSCFQGTVQWVSISEILKDPFIWVLYHDLQFHPLSLYYW